MCEQQGKNGQRGHCPKPRKGKQFAQSEHEELEDCSNAPLLQAKTRYSNLPHATISPGRARTAAVVLGSGRTQELSSHSHHNTQGASLCTHTAMRQGCPGMLALMSYAEIHQPAKSWVKRLQSPFTSQSHSILPSHVKAKSEFAHPMLSAQQHPRLNKMHIN